MEALLFEHEGKLRLEFEVTCSGSGFKTLLFDIPQLLGFCATCAASVAWVNDWAPGRGSGKERRPPVNA